MFRASSHLYWNQRLTVLACCFVTVISSVSPEVWVSVGDRLESGDHHLTIPGAAYLTGISAYRLQDVDDSGVVFLATDTNKRGAALYKIHKNNVSKLYEDENSSFFESVVYSPANRDIYLTSPATNSIIRLDESGAVSSVDLSPEKPSGLAIDPCTSTIYWSSTAPGRGKVLSFKELSNISEEQQDIKESSVVVVDGLSKPRGLAVDQHTGQLYWTDQTRNQFSIYRIGLQGELETMVAEERGEPFSIAISDTKVYWSDWSRAVTFTINKDKANQSPEIVERFKSSKPNGITYVPNQTVSCSGRDAAVLPLLTSSSTQRSTTTQSIETTTDASDNRWCMNGVKDSQGDCLCSDGWTGTRCQTSLCYNYCLGEGVCSMVENHPVCFCHSNQHGDRCEFADDVVPILPVSTLNQLMFVLPALLAIQFIVILVLSLLVTRHRKRPRIVRKRFISSSKTAKVKEVKNSCSGSGVGGGDDGIQLDIEDCCNMAMCDTPCFDPPTRVPKDVFFSPSKSNKQDKRGLLDDDCDDNYAY